MTAVLYRNKITPQLLDRKAIVYLRQSSERQVLQNTESRRLQYALADRARELGWKRVEVIDTDLGCSAAMGAPERAGFDRLLASVACGEVGVVFSRELSRLSRTDKDWCHLMDVCQLFGTLLADADQIYDLALMDDLLVLGIKATMSVVELKVLKMRLQQGSEEKARRGELARVLPPGYVRDATGKVVKDPDARVREAVDLVIRKFRELRSVRQTFSWLHTNEIQVPVNKSDGTRLRIAWQLPSHSFIGNLLRNPFYAGAYVWGQRTTEMKLQDGKVVKRQGSPRRPEEGRVLIRDHHEGYIDWETFEENLRWIRGNSLALTRDESVGAVRAGQGLLAGLLRCGRCGRKLHVWYWGKSGTAARYLCKGEYAQGGKYCLAFGGGTVDRRFSEELLRVVSPLGTRAALEAVDRLREGEREKRQAFLRQIEQTTYEARRAFEQYNEVDPRHRLVAEELERRWNAKLDEEEKLKTALAEMDRTAHRVTDEEAEEILALGDHFADVWASEHCPVEVKKRIFRTVVEEVIANVDESGETLRFVVHWKGGSHTLLSMDKPGQRTAHKTALSDVDLIRRMAQRYDDAEIARVLNKLGHPTGKGNRWNQHRVATVRRRNGIPIASRVEGESDILTLGQAAKRCGVSKTTIKRLAMAGLIRKEQVAPFAAWEIRRKDLESQAVQAAIERLRQTGVLDLEAANTEDQPKLFP